MKTILTSCGYNNAWAFKDVDQEKITEIESFIETSNRKIAESFDEYKGKRPFTFLPGHRSLILGIKNQILLIEDINKPKKPNTKSVPDEKDLIAMLIKQVSQYSSRLSLKLNWNDAVQKFEGTTDGDDTSIQCVLSCPLCYANRTIRFDKYWRVSNLFKHLRSHIQSTGKTDKAEKEPNKLKIKPLHRGANNQTASEFSTYTEQEFEEEFELYDVVEETSDCNIEE